MLVYLLLLAPLLVAFAMVAYVWVRYYSLSLRWTTSVAPLPPAVNRESLEDGQTWSCQTVDDVTIRGSYLPALRNRCGVSVVFCHQLFGSRWSAAPYIAGLCASGYDVFSFDFRNHGDSDKGPDYTPTPTLTQCEVKDLHAVIDYVCSQQDNEHHGVVLMGASKGAAVALHAAAHDARVRAVIADGAFSNDWITAHFLRRYIGIATPLAVVLKHFPWFLYLAYAKIVQASLARRAGVYAHDILKVAGRIQQPVLLIQGEKDSYVPVDMARKLVRRIGRNCKLWVVAGANHNGAIHKAPAKYQDRIVRFLTKQSFAEPEPAVGQTLSPESVDPDSTTAPATI